MGEFSRSPSGDVSIVNSLGSCGCSFRFGVAVRGTGFRLFSTSFGWFGRFFTFPFCYWKWGRICNAECENVENIFIKSECIVR